MHATEDTTAVTSAGRTIRSARANNLNGPTQSDPILRPGPLLFRVCSRSQEGCLPGRTTGDSGATVKGVSGLSRSCSALPLPSDGWRAGWLMGTAFRQRRIGGVRLVIRADFGIRAAERNELICQDAFE